MSAVVRTNAQWWVLIPLSLHGCSQRQQSEAHIATALTADWTRACSARSPGPLRLPVYLAALRCCLCSSHQLGCGEATCKPGAAERQWRSILARAPTVCASGCFYRETCGRQTLQSVLHRKLRTKGVGGGGIDLLLRVSSKSGSTKWNPLETTETQTFTMKRKHQPPST